MPQGSSTGAANHFFRLHHYPLLTCGGAKPCLLSFVLLFPSRCCSLLIHYISPLYIYIYIYKSVDVSLGTAPELYECLRPAV